jgi:hypothetical protein
VPTGTFVYHSDEERLAIEAAIAYVTELRQLARAAPAGQVLDRCEEHALTRGRDLLRDGLRQAVQARVDEAEQKGGLPGAVRARARSASSGGVAGK